VNTKRPEDKPGSTAPPQPYPGYPPPYWYYPPEQETSLLEYWGAIVKRKFTVILITLVTTGVALAAAFLMTPIYRAETVLAPVSEKRSGGLEVLAGQFGDLAALTGINLSRSENSTEEAIATLKSRALTNGFIKEENLMPILFAEKWDAENKKWKDQRDTPTPWDAFELFDEDIRSVKLDRKTGLVTLAIEWKNPVLAAKWADQIVQRVNAVRRTDAIQDAEKSIAYLKKELAKTNAVEIQQAIYRLIEAQTKTKMLASIREQYAFKVIDPAIPPEEKAKPKRSLIVILGFMLGAMAGIFTAFFRRFLENQREEEQAGSE